MVRFEKWSGPIWSRPNRGAGARDRGHRKSRQPSAISRDLWARLDDRTIGERSQDVSDAL
jgi:hypothetical protein